MHVVRFDTFAALREADSRCKEQDFKRMSLRVVALSNMAGVEKEDENSIQMSRKFL